MSRNDAAAYGRPFKKASRLTRLSEELPRIRGATSVGELAWGICCEFVDHVILVSDDSIRESQRWLWRELRIIAEPGGATAFAALLSGAYHFSPSERVGVLVCGANADLHNGTF